MRGASSPQGTELSIAPPVVTGPDESIMKAASTLQQAILNQHHQQGSLALHVAPNPNLSAHGRRQQQQQQQQHHSLDHTMKDAAAAAASSTDEEEEDDDDDDEMDSSGCQDRQHRDGVERRTTLSSRTGRRYSAQYRAERNAREKERSLRISQQIDELRQLLLAGGVVVPKTTKSSILSATARYIRILQEEQQQEESQQKQQDQRLEKNRPPKAKILPAAPGALASQSAVSSPVVDCAIAAAFSSQLPAAVSATPPGTIQATIQASPFRAITLPSLTGPATVPASSSVQEADYKALFESSQLGMALATLGGAIQNCNRLFCLLSNIPKEKLTTMTVFALVDQRELQRAFECISRMISPDQLLQSMLGGTPPLSYSFNGSMPNTNLGLNVHLVRCSYTGAAKCLGVTLIRNPTTIADVFSPATAADLVQNHHHQRIPEVPRPVHR